jgi:glycosyltransferase involved in cell wall biosynthesis
VTDLLRDLRPSSVNISGLYSAAARGRSEISLSTWVHTFNMFFSVCIPTLNASGVWKILWGSLKAQTLQPSEVIVLDSSSTDGTAELAKQDGCRVVTISREQFRHGGTRQHAAELASGADVLVYLTQDSILADANALARLTAAFEDASVGAAYGRQLPRPGANPIEAHARLFNYPPVSAIRSLEDRVTMGFKAIFFSNSFGAYRRTALEQVGGFPKESNFGEDTVVAARLLQSGWRIAYVAEAQAYHSHAYSCRDEFRRYFRIGQLHGTEPWLLRDFGKASGAGRRFALSEIQYLSGHAPWLIPEAMLRTGLKYLGYKRGRRNPQP